MGGVWACATAACGSGGRSPRPGPFQVTLSALPPASLGRGRPSHWARPARCWAPRRPAAPRLSAFGARGEKAQRMAPAHDPPPQPPTPGERTEVLSSCLLGTGVLLCSGRGGGDIGSSPGGSRRLAEWWGRGTPTWRGTG